MRHQSLRLVREWQVLAVFAVPYRISIQLSLVVALGFCLPSQASLIANSWKYSLIRLSRPGS